MANYHVSRDREEKMWKAQKEGASKVSGFYETQKEAEKAAKRFSGKSGGGEVKIHGLDGKIRDADTVPPGYDPCPPKDKVH